MPAMSFGAIKEAISRFIPESIRENPFISAMLAGAAATVILLALPAFAPVGVVGALGWLIIYAVTGGTLSIQVAREVYKARKKLGEDGREDLDAKLVQLKKARDDGALTDEEYKERAKDLVDSALELGRNSKKKKKEK
jgi:predicted Rdx family selenoprotein